MRRWPSAAATVACLAFAGPATAAPSVQEFSDGLSPAAGLADIVLGPDGNLWFAEKDVDKLGRVINFDLPENGSLFTHRVGRTGRMGRAGQAITLLDPEDQPKWRQLEKELKAAGLKQSLPRKSWTGPLPPGVRPAPPVSPLDVIRPVRDVEGAPVREYRPETRLARGAPRPDGRRWRSRGTRPANPSASQRGGRQPVGSRTQGA